MKIKKFIAPTLKEATLLMKKELGNDAYILSTRVVNKRTDIGIQKHFEITSGIEEELDLVLAEVDNNIPTKEVSFNDELMKLQRQVLGNTKTNGQDDTIVIAPKIKKRPKISSEQLKHYVDKLIYQEVSKPIIKTI